MNVKRYKMFSTVQNVMQMMCQKRNIKKGLILFTFLLWFNVHIGLSNEPNLNLPSLTFVAMVTKFETT